MDKKYFEDPELNKLLTSWLSIAPESLHPLDVKRFIQFSIKAMELNKYDFQIIENALRENNAHARKNDEIIDSYEMYFCAIDSLYKELKEQGKLKKDADY